MLEQLKKHFLQMARLPVEEIHVWFLDNRGTIVFHWIPARGDSRGASISLRELFRMAWVHNACSMLIAHNHPNGERISQEDDEFTERVRKIGLECEVNLIDHLVVIGTNNVFSILQNTYLD